MATSHAEQHRHIYQGRCFYGLWKPNSLSMHARLEAQPFCGCWEDLVQRSAWTPMAGSVESPAAKGLDGVTA